MKPNPSSLRQFGQSSLPFSFLPKSSSTTPKEVTSTKTPKKAISLSDFLNRKLGNANGKTIQEKPSSFSSIGFGKEKTESKKDNEIGSGPVLDTAVFHGFKRPVNAAGDVEENDGGVGEEEFQSDSTWDGQILRKRKCPFAVCSGDDEWPRDPKHTTILGEKSKPKYPQPKRRTRKNMVENAKPKPFYNHYENGLGLWDGDREGVDSEEVGCNEAWEGMGSTTLGGLEWH